MVYGYLWDCSFYWCSFAAVMEPAVAWVVISMMMHKIPAKKRRKSNTDILVAAAANGKLKVGKE